MDSKTKNDCLLTAINASLKAGEKILEIYNSEFAIEHKEDKSPLTLADQNAHDEIETHLKETKLPVLSEEGKDIPFEERADWNYFWIVDPLDGTKEFIKRNGEFTVNIALIHKDHPVMGVIYVPVKNILYFSLPGKGAYKAEGVQAGAKVSNLDDLLNNSLKLPVNGNHAAFRVVGSRSHMSPETKEFIEKLRKEHGEIEIVSMGSSLKICLVAEGAADVYPRFAPTMEWDTAAGQAIAEAAGKTLIDCETGKPMRYNRKNLRNNWFLVK